MQSEAPGPPETAAGALEELARPVQVITVRAGGDLRDRYAVPRDPFAVASVLDGVFLRCEAPAASPRLVADAPVPDAERIALSVGSSLFRQRRSAGGRV